MIQSVALEKEDWDQIQRIIATSPLPWTLSNPLLMRIAQQLQRQGEAGLRDGQAHLETKQ